MRLLTRRGFTAVALVAASAASAACVDQKESGVSLVKFDSSTVFGAAKPTELPGFDLPTNFDNFPIDDLSPIPIAPGLPDPGPCPDAALTSFPKATASVTVKGTPPLGVYTWKRVSTRIINRDVKPPETTLPFGLESRAVRRIERKNDHEFSYQVVAPDPTNSKNKVITTYVVNTNKTLLVDRTIPGRTIGVIPVPSQDVRLGVPNDMGGIYISRIETQNETGSRVSLFAPLTPVLIFPMDGGIVRAGQTFQSIGIDPTSQTILTNNGTILPQNRIDACGEIVEGYTVSLTQTFTSDLDRSNIVSEIDRYGATLKTRELVMVFATQYGGLPIRELLTVGRPLTDRRAFVGQWELGGLTPAALPDSIK